jgi:hypothetical protein
MKNLQHGLDDGDKCLIMSPDNGSRPTGMKPTIPEETMRKLIAFTAVALATMLSSSWAANAPDPKLAPGPVEVAGKLQTGMMAIGGETTGTILSVPDQGTFELDVKGNEELEKAVDSLKGKMVKVTGTLTVKEGVEIRERRIIKVDTLVVAPAAPEEKK